MSVDASVLDQIQERLSNGQISRAIRLLRKLESQSEDFLSAAVLLAGHGVELDLGFAQQAELIESNQENLTLAVAASILSACRVSPHTWWDKTARSALKGIAKQSAQGWLELGLIAEHFSRPEADLAFGMALSIDPERMAWLRASESLRTEILPASDNPDPTFVLSVLSAIQTAESGRHPRIEDTIEVLDNAIAPVACAYLKHLAQPQLQPAQVIDPITGEATQHPYRNNRNANVTPETGGPFVHALREWFAGLAGVTAEHIEPIAILHYSPGQEFRPHCDWIDTRDGSKAEEVRRYGQRSHTVLLYLNTPEAGGELVFTRKDCKIDSQQGRCVAFRNIDALCRPDPDSHHASVAVAEGEKWVASLWIRQHPIR